jgi:hypothetical protein
MFDDLTHSTTFQALMSVVTGGAFVGWYREHRKGRKDAYVFAMDLLAQQNARIDALVSEVATLKARHDIATDALDILKQENAELKLENSRLKTALGEHGRAA